MLLLCLPLFNRRPFGRDRPQCRRFGFGGHRLTPLGQLRYDALPKAPLLTRPRSIQAITGYVEGLIDKAQSRARAGAEQAQGDTPPSSGGSNHEDDERGGQTAAIATAHE